ncbi:S8 family serine peptidase [Solitalea sp. MAHUQ-68]|uniref:S8 family serine peptidase n=1 Tax=Solitalea agri TaxID=2953739 RepID=A0A9X2JB70_9SPHI|nr:MBG domain-containing protein [Solitalea agri]MCO4292177.1 S8 family serine peptidase [Solitalea agri]
MKISASEKTYLPSNRFCKLILLSINLFLLLSISAKGQNLAINDFVVFGGNPSIHGSAAADFSVILGSGSSVYGGSVGSSKLIKTIGGVQFTSNLISDGTIYLANGNSVLGTIAAANSASSKEIIFKTGTNQYFKKNIDINGSIFIRGGKVLGKVTYPKGSTYSGPIPAGGKKMGTPTLTAIPQLPAITVFPDAGIAKVTSTQIITPGCYNAMELKGGQTITFSGAGTYTFSSIKNTGTTPNKFIFDLKDNPGGTIKIYVHGDIDLNITQVDFVNGCDASKIYTETHGIGTSCKLGNYAFTINNYSSSSRCSEWFGTVWAPYGGINIGSTAGRSTITGALWSATKVNIQCGVKITYAPFIECTKPIANAGADVNFTCPQTQVQLNGSCLTPNVQFSWKAIDGGNILSGANTAKPIVNKKGRYILTVTNPKGGCTGSDTVTVTYTPCILPYYPPPENGKANELIGAELAALAAFGDSVHDPQQNIFILNSDSVWVEVIVKEGRYQQALTLLTSNEFGLTNLIDNGNSQFIISGKMPVRNLEKLNQQDAEINYCRPLFPAISGAGIANTQGDAALRSNFLRNGYGLDGDSIKVGVLSDSYNTLPGNPAAVDVANGDLPGITNPDFTDPVEVFGEYPFGRRSDEGRAMLQIIHDIAPKAKLAFRTGFVSAGDLAQGIRELQQANCDVMVDDVTFITEPFFQDGVVTQAVNEVSALGVAYFTSAGNFGNKSYQATFNPAPSPPGLTGSAHNFGGGDVLQNISLQPGTYTIVLQWQDPIYSLGQTETGTVNDLDIYLTDDSGSTLFGFNRDNLGGDPIEILPFTVTMATTTNILINRAAGTGNVALKYIIFRGEATINEYNAGTSTIIGQANAPAAFTIGAVRYSQTPAAGINPPLIESYSSVGGPITINGIPRNKPDFTAPDGINTSVNLGSIDYEGDGLPNFFGTSAAAPHAAAVAALMKQARKRYFNENYNNADLKALFASTALDMNTPGFDYISGNGFMRADVAIQSFAAAKPELIRLIVPENITPGPDDFTLQLRAKYISPDTKVLFRDDTLTTAYVNDSTATAAIPQFTGNPTIRAFTPSRTPTGRDGGISNSITFFEIQKKNITITADNKTIKYGEKLPVFTAKIRVDGKPLDSSGLTLTDIGLDSIVFTTPATSTSNVNNYILKASRTFNPDIPADAGFTELYNYNFIDGFISIQKMPLTVTPRDTTLTYGEKVGDIHFNYQFDPSVVLDDPEALMDTVLNYHQEQLANDYIGLINSRAVAIVNGRAVPIVNGQEVSIENGRAVAIVNGRAVAIVNSQGITIVNGRAVPIVNNLVDTQLSDLSFLTTEKTLEGARQVTNQKIVNGNIISQTSNIIDITQESVLDFNINSGQTYMLNSITNVSPRGLIDLDSYTNKRAVTIVNGRAVAIVNGLEITEVNGRAVTIVNGRAVTIVNGQAVPIVNSEDKTAIIIDEQEIGLGLNGLLKSLNMVTGINNGLNYIIPGALRNDNFEISYGLGKLTILPVPISITARDTSKSYGQAITLNPKAFSISDGTLMFDDSIKTVTLSSTGTTASASAGQYPIVPSAAVGSDNTALSNYNIAYINGTLSVGKATLKVKANDAFKEYGNPNPTFTATFKGFLNGQTFETSEITGALAFSTPATQFSNVGIYPILVSIGTLASTNYTFDFTDCNAKLTINKAPLNIIADNKVINQGDPLPKFTAQFITLKAGETPTLTFTLSPYYKGKVGQYSIIPSACSFPTSSNYTITYTNGTLYVNPDCRYAKKLRIYLDCVEEVSGTANYKYVAHFKCENPNSSSVYIEKGIDNQIMTSGQFDDSLLPQFFASGITTFDILFDGKTLYWQINTIESNKKTAIAGTASSSSARCHKTQDYASSQQGNVNSWGSSNGTDLKMSLSVYPNPAKTLVTIKWENDVLNTKTCLMYDMYGQLYPVKITQKINDSSFEIDMTGLREGLYYLRVTGNSGYKFGRIIKE